MTESLTDQAIRFLVDHGLPMIPSRGRTKSPCVPWKVFQTQLPTVEQLRDWDKKFRPDRWGLVTGQLSRRVVLDFDGETGRKWMREWGIEPHLRTGSGGFHCHLLHPGWRVPTLNAKSAKMSWPWPGVDIRGDGGFAVVLGRNSNGPYEPLREFDPEPLEILPADVRTFLQEHDVKREPSKLSQAFSQPFNIGERRVEPGRLIRNALEIAYRSGRNNAGLWLACQLRDNGDDLGVAESAMRSYWSLVPSTNAKGIDEPYTEREMLASLVQAYSRCARDPWRNLSPHVNAASPAAAPARFRRGKNVSPVQSETLNQVHNADTESINLYVGHTGVPVVGHTGVPPPRSQYARVPCEVLSDHRLKSVDLRVYSALSSVCWQGSTASLGKRRIAELAPCAERLVAPSLRRLEAAGHISKVAVKRGERGIYHLRSQVFGQKQRAGIDEMIITPDDRRRLASVRRDPGEGRTARG